LFINSIQQDEIGSVSTDNPDRYKNLIKIIWSAAAQIPLNGEVLFDGRLLFRFNDKCSRADPNVVIARLLLIG
jgi:hypothetical protein